MKSIKLFTLGTPYGSWIHSARALANAFGGSFADESLTHWIDLYASGARASFTRMAAKSAESLRQHLNCEGDESVGFLDSHTCCVLDSIKVAVPDALYLVFVQGPAESLLYSESLEDSESGDPSRVLNLWVERARDILRLLHEIPEQVLLVYEPEVRGRLFEVGRACCDKWGLNIGTVIWPNVPSADPVRISLAVSIAEGHERAIRTFQELHASCHVFMGSSTLPPEGEGLVQPGTLRKAWFETSRVLRLSSGTGRESPALRIGRGPHPVCETLRLSADEEILLLNLQLHRAQQEIDELVVSTIGAKVTTTASPTVGPKSNSDAPGSFEWGTERLVTPHKEINVRIKTLAIVDKLLSDIDIKIVEHHGKPGLLLFRSQKMELLCQWQSNGSEDGRDFLLIVPDDAPSQKYLMNLGASDWKALVELVEKLENSIRTPSLLYSPIWYSVVSKLKLKINHLAPRLRYDRVQASRLPSDQSAIEIHYVNSMFGNNPVGDLRMIWNTGARGPSGLKLVADDERAPPFESWPTQHDGKWCREWEPPVPHDGWRTDRARRWFDLANDERQLLIGMMDTLPGVIEAVSADSAVKEEIERSREPLRMSLRAQRMRNLADGVSLFKRRLFRFGRS